MTGTATGPPDGPPSGRTLAFAVGGWLLLSLVVQLALGWYLPRVGDSLAGPLVVVLLSGAGMLAFGFTGGITWLIARRCTGTAQVVTLGALSVGALAVAVLASVWTLAWSLPLHVLVDENALTAVIEHAQALKVDPQTGCVASPASLPPVPGIGAASSVCLEPGQVMLDGSRGPVGFMGYLYVTGTLQASELCVRHLYGPWWEADPSALAGGCAFGFAQSSASPSG